MPFRDLEFGVKFRSGFGVEVGSGFRVGFGFSGSRKPHA